MQTLKIDVASSPRSLRPAPPLHRRADSDAEDGRLETTAVQIGKIAGICLVAQYVAEDLLRGEGFTDIRYVPTEPGTKAALALARGEIDFTTNFSPPLIIAIDAGEPITMVAGVHVGCFELFAKEGIRSIPDLKGKTVGVQALGSSQYTFVSGMASYVGLEPAKDIRWVTSSSPKPMELFAEEKSMRFSVCRPSRRNCAPATSVM